MSKSDLKKQILFISNGHGEDLNGSLIAQSLRSLSDDFVIDSFPIVGEGKSYQNKNIKIVAPIQAMPSGGIFYLNPLNFLQDLWSGLISLTLQQIKTINQIKNNYDFVVAVGDVVPLFFAYLTGKNYVSFIVSTSSYYEGKLKLPWLTKLLLRSSRCQQIYTRDQYTAKDLQRQGLTKAIFAGYPIMDTLTPTGHDLSLSPENPLIALVPGSRVPEALRNLKLQLQVVEKLVSLSPTKWQFRAALVPSITNDDLAQIAQELDWQYSEQTLSTTIDKQHIEVKTYNNAFADILQASSLVLGMAGTAVEQAVGLGKPVVQTPGKGPQFTYRFAEAQMRLLGLNVLTIADHPDQDMICEQTARKIMSLLNDEPFLAQCIDNGKERVGEKGGSLGIAQQIKLTIQQKN
jgi:uncharacterized protein (TIGR03492 family)